MRGFIMHEADSDLIGALNGYVPAHILHKIKNDELTLLVEKENRSGQYTLLKTKGLNVHVMNKFSLNREIANA